MQFLYYQKTHLIVEFVDAQSCNLNYNFFESSKQLNYFGIMILSFMYPTQSIRLYINQNSLVQLDPQKIIKIITMHD